jgi:hypothetical protein
MIVARQYIAGAGTQNAGLAAGGYTPTFVACTEEYNGTSWSAGGALIIARVPLGAGTQGAAFVAGGFTTVAVSCTEEYNKPLAIIDCIK